MILFPGLFLPLFAYAETHYRFKYFVSFLKKDEPEFLADAPHRIEPGKAIPVLLLFKDADKYPCTLHQVTIRITQGSRTILTKTVLGNPVFIDTPLWWVVEDVKYPGLTGWAQCDVMFDIQRKGSRRVYHNDNLRTSSRKPLDLFLSTEKLPTFPGLHFGDIHTHSTYTDDHVEFGSPIAASRSLSKAMGISFFGVADHSYDLDDEVGNYLRNDPALPKWNQLKREIRQVVSEDKNFVVLLGEEVSCRNNDDKNVHLLLLGNKDFLPGSGDSAEKWLRTWSQHDIGDILRMKNRDAIAFAPHATEPVPFLQRMLLGRGNWHSSDFEHTGLAGIQFANGNKDAAFDAGYREWIAQLLKGKRWFAVAGNDAHGNFNRFRQIHVPFVKVVERDTQLFGKMRTGVFLDRSFSEHSLFDGIRKGRCIITDGPALNLKVNRSSSTSIGGEFRQTRIRPEVTALSSKEFGSLAWIRLVLGEIGDSSERELASFSKNLGHKFRETIPLTIRKPCYIRAEVFTAENSFDKKSHFCFTNPVWFNPR